jgi:hypothetical protein
MDEGIMLDINNVRGPFPAPSLAVLMSF